MDSGACGKYPNLGSLTNRTLDRWPKETQRVFLDFETGVNVKTGGVLHDGAPHSSPCRRAYEIFCRVNVGWCDGFHGTDRCSWDIQALVYAVRGAENFYTLEPGHNEVNPRTGYNTWTAWTPPLRSFPNATYGSTAPPNATHAPNDAVQSNATMDATLWRGGMYAAPAEYTLLLPTELYGAVVAEINQLLLRRPMLR